jgi:hypothetical protein
MAYPLNPKAYPESTLYVRPDPDAAPDLRHHPDAQRVDSPLGSYDAVSTYCQCKPHPFSASLLGINLAGMLQPEQNTLLSYQS